MSWLITGAVVIVSGAALVGWSALGASTIQDQARQLLGVPRALWIPGAIGFAISNAVAEEVVFRGAIWDGFGTVIPRWGAIAVTALLFAGFHLYGFPGGPIGMAMVLVWGIALGILRVRSAGMLAPIVAHIGADLVVFGILAVQAAAIGG